MDCRFCKKDVPRKDYYIKKSMCYSCWDFVGPLSAIVEKLSPVKRNENGNW